MLSTSRLVFKQDILNFLGPRFNALFKRFAQPLTTTGLAADTTTLVDSKLGRGTRSANDYDGCQIEIVETVGSGPTVDTEGARSGVNNAGFAEPATLTVSPAFTAAVESGADYLLYPPGLSPESLNEAINGLLRHTEAPHIWVPSMIDDADFEANDLTKWAAVGTPDTRAFVTTASRLLLGERALRLVTSTTLHGAQSQAVPVTENEQLLVSVNVLVLSGNCRVDLYNDTASTVIRSVTVDEERFTEVRFSEPVPDGCENVRLRFVSVTASSEFFISGPVVLQSAAERSYAPPSWLLSMEKVLDVLLLPVGWGSEVADSYASLTRQAESWSRPTELRADRNVNPVWLQFQGTAQGVTAVLAFRPFAELTTNAATTPCDREYVKWKAIANILKAHGEDDWRQHNRVALGLARALRYGERVRRMVDNPKVLV